MQSTKLRYTMDTVTSKGSGKANEDSHYTDMERGLAAVFDGMTSLNPFTDSKGRTGGQLASQIARDTFSKGYTNLRQAVKDIDKAIAEAMLERQIDITDKRNLWATSIGAIRIREGGRSLDWIQVSDTNVLVIFKGWRYQLMVNNYDHDKETLSKMKAALDSGAKDAWKSVEKEIHANRQLMNVDAIDGSGYGAIAGEGYVKGVQSGRVHIRTLHWGNLVPEVSHVVIFSDGMLIPKRDPRKDDDIATIVELLRKGGLREWHDYVRATENSDDPIRNFARFKVHDDATAVSISFGGR